MRDVRRKTFFRTATIITFVLIAWCVATPRAAALTTITTCVELQEMRLDLTEDYVLGNDIDCTTDTSAGGVLYNDGAGFEPVGPSGADAFLGSFDGQGFTITGLFINRGNTTNVGLFGVADGGAVTDVGIIDATITGDESVGALSGSGDAVINRSYSTGTITGTTTVGGLVGTNGVEVSDSYSRADVVGGSLVGGLLGSNGGGTISRSYATGNVTGNSSVGGFAGDNGGTIEDSFWDTDTSGQTTGAGGTGKTSTEMKNRLTYTDTATVGLDTAWNFNDVWTIDADFNGGYPILRWQTFDEPSSSPSVGGGGSSHRAMSRSAPRAVEPPQPGKVPPSPVADILVRIAELRAQVAALTGEDETPSACPYFTRNHARGDVGGEVSAVQQFLKDHGFFTFPSITGYYGFITEAAVRAFQAAHADAILAPLDLTEPSGNWYEATRETANDLLGCTIPSA